MVCFLFLKNESFLPLKHQNEEVNYSVTGSETTKVMGLKREEVLLWWSSVKRLYS